MICLKKSICDCGRDVTITFVTSSSVLVYNIWPNERGTHLSVFSPPVSLSRPSYSTSMMRSRLAMFGLHVNKDDYPIGRFNSLPLGLNTQISSELPYHGPGSEKRINYKKLSLMPSIVV
jgi:hypothetical protein